MKPLKLLLLLIATAIALNSYSDELLAPGNALKLDGVDDYLTSDYALPFHAQSTFILWIYPESDGTLLSAEGQWFGSSQRTFLQLKDGKIQQVYEDNNTIQKTITSNATIKYNEWNQIALVSRMGSSITEGYITIYVNGINSEETKGIAYFALKDFTIGATKKGSIYSNHFKGLIDETSIWRETFNAESLKNYTQNRIDYKKSQSLELDNNKPSGLHTYLSFDQATIENHKTLDLTDNNYDFTLHNLDELNCLTPSLALIEPIIKEPTNISGESFELNWQKSIISTENIEYHLDVDNDPDFTSPFITNKKIGNTFNYEVNDLKDNTTYYYRIQAKNESQKQKSLNASGQVTLPKIKEISISNFLNNTNAYEVPLQGNWQLNVEGHNSSDLFFFLGEGSAPEIQINGSSLSINKLQPSTNKVYLYAFNKNEKIIAHDSLSFTVPNFDIDGLYNVLYEKNAYPLNFVSQQNMTNIEWETLGRTAAGKTFTFNSPSTGEGLIKLTAKYNNIAFYKRFRFNIKSIPTLKVSKNDETLFAGIKYPFEVTNNFEKSYSFTPKSIIWYVDGVEVTRGLKTNIALKSGTREVKVIVTKDELMKIEKQFLLKVYEKPTIQIESISGIIGDNINEPIIIKNIPSGITLKTVITNTELDLTVNNGRLVGALSLKKGKTIYGKPTIQLISENGVIVASHSIEMDILPDVEIDVPRYAESGVSFALKGSTSTEDLVKKWNWIIESGGQIKNYYSKNINLRLNAAGDYFVKLEVTNPYGNTNSTTERKISVKPASKSFTIITDPVMPEQIQVNENILIDFDADLSSSTYRTFSFAKLPEGARASSNGEVNWTPKEVGRYTFIVKCTSYKYKWWFRMVKNKEAIFNATVNVVDESVDVSMNLIDGGGEKVQNASIKVYRKEYTNYVNSSPKLKWVKKTSLYSDEQGKVYQNQGSSKLYTINVLKDKEYRFVIQKDNMPETTDLHTFTDNTPHQLTYDIQAIVIQGMTIIAKEVNYNATSKTYTLADAEIDGLVKFNGDISIDVRNNDFAILKTKGTITIISSNTVIAQTKDKEYTLGDGFIVPNNKDSRFQLEDVSGVGMYGAMISLSNNTVEIGAFPEFPWVLGDYMDDKALDFSGTCVNGIKGQLSNMGPFLAAQELKNKKPSTTGSKNKKSERMKNIYFAAQNNGFPEIEIVRKFTETNKYWDFSMIGLAVATPSGMGLNNLDIIYKESEQLFECNAEISWGSGDDKPKSRGDINSLNSIPADSLDVLLADIKQQFANDASLDSVIIEIVDERNNIIHQTTYGEYDDISSTIEEEQKRKGLPIEGFGVEIRIIDGLLDKIAIKVQTAIPLGTLPLELKEVSGGLDSLTTRTPDGKVVYRSEGWWAYIECLIADKSGFDIVTIDGRIEMKAYSHFKGEGALNIFDNEVGYASVQYTDGLFKAFAESSTMGAGFLKGEVGIQIETADEFAFIGYGSMTVQLPSCSPIPSPFQDMKLGQAEAGISNELVAVKVTIGSSSDSRLEVGRRRTEGKRWGSFFKKAYKVVSAPVRVVVDVVDVVVETTVKVGNAVVSVAEEFIKFLSIEIGVSYNFDTGKFKFGSDIEVPRVVRRVSRGNTLIEDFVINQDIRKFYIMVDNEGVSEVEYQLFDPSGLLVNYSNKVFYPKGKTWLEVIDMPDQGTWSIHIDTVKYPGAKAKPMMLNNAPVGKFLSPISVDTTKTQITLKFNDSNDTLDVAVFIDDDKKGFDGKQVTTFKVANNANIKFNYEPDGLSPGKYYFYFRMQDKSAIPITQYAPGALVISGGNLDAPANLKYEQIENKLHVYWSPSIDENVNYVSLSLKDLVTGDVFEEDVFSYDSVLFSNINYSHKYELSAYSVGDYDYSEKLVIREIMPQHLAENKAPIWAGAPYSTFVFKEGKKAAFALNVIDPNKEGVEVTLLENYPKGFAISQDSIIWCPVIGDKGAYTFHAIASDGINSDTIKIRCDVNAVYKRDLYIEFPTANLYEADNMFVKVTDLSNEADKVNVLIWNMTSNDTISVNASAVAKGEFIGDFQLSYQRRSILPVSDGDTIVAMYRKDTSYIANYAYFESTPQVSDTIAPFGINNLKVEEYSNDLLLLSFTTPYDQMNNGILTAPWVYDIRYNYSALNNEAQYFSSYKVEQYNIGKPGETDSILINKRDLYDFDLNHKVFFTVKVGDTKFNYSPISNVADFNYITFPKNLVAVINEDYNIALNWDGTKVVTQDTTFIQYNIFRQEGNQGFSFINTSFVSEFTDTINNRVEDGLLSYAVEAVYQNTVSDTLFSNALTVERFTDVTVAIIDSIGKFKDFIVNLEPISDSYEVRKDTTSISGVVTFYSTFNTQYYLTVSQNDTTWFADSIEVSDDNFYFDYVVSGKATPVGLSTNYSHNAFLVYPSPSDGLININYVNKTNNALMYTIYSISGSAVNNGIIRPGANLTEIDLRMLQNGKYMISIHSSEGTYRKGFIISK